METSKRTFNPPIAIAILEKSSTDVSYCWKACQIFSYVIVVISGIATCLAMGNISRMFESQCVLYSNLSVELVSNHSEIHLKPLTDQHWGSKSKCDFCQYSPVASVIAAGIWTTLFVMCGRGGKTTRPLPQPWRIVPPAIVFNFVFMIISCVSVVLTFGGFSAFCSSIQASLNITSCDDLMDYSWKSYPNATYFYDDVIIAETGAAVTLAGWLMGFVILLIRCLTHADFMILSRTSSRDDGDARTSVQSDSQSSTSSSRVNSLQSSSQATSPEKPSKSFEAEPLIVVSTEHPRKSSGQNRSKS